LLKHLTTYVLLAGIFFFGISAHQAAARTPPASDGETASASVAGSGVETPPPPCRILYAGFVGAMEPAGNKHSGVVQIRDTLRGPDYSDVCAESFLPISWISGRDWILKHFPSHSGPLTQQELANAPRVILVGHSTGGWAMLSVARDLRDKDIPVELTIQVDSVGITDYTIPKNVKTGAIFHAWDILMFMTTKNLKLEDPLHTKLIANVVVHGANHLSVTRDPRIRSLVMNAVEKLRAESEAAAQQQPPPADSLPHQEKVLPAPGSGPSD
jgi:hypothetical protein